MAELCIKMNTETGALRVTDEEDKPVTATWDDTMEADVRTVLKGMESAVDLDKWKVILYRHGSPACYWYDRRII